EALARAVRAAFGAGARIVAAERLFGDASSRRYVRLRLADGGAPPTVVAMLLGADRFPLGSDELGERAASDELPFVSGARYRAARALGARALHRARHRDAPRTRPRGRPARGAARRAGPARSALRAGSARARPSRLHGLEPPRAGRAAPPDRLPRCAPGARRVR